MADLMVGGAVLFALAGLAFGFITTLYFAIV